MKKLVSICLALVLCAGAFAAPASAKKEKKTVTTVFVTDIECDHCVKKIMDNVPSLGKGIKDVRVDLPKKEVTVVYDASKNDDANIVEGFASLKVKAERRAGRLSGRGRPARRFGAAAFRQVIRPVVLSVGLRRSSGDPVVGCPVSARAAYRAGCLRAGGRAGLSQEGAASVLSGSPGGGSALRIGASGFRAGRSSASCRRGAFPVGEWNLRPGPSPFRDGKRDFSGFFGHRFVSRI